MEFKPNSLAIMSSINRGSSAISDFTRATESSIVEYSTRSLRKNCKVFGIFRTIVNPLVLFKRFQVFNCYIQLKTAYVNCN